MFMTLSLLLSRAQRRILNARLSNRSHGSMAHSKQVFSECKTAHGPMAQEAPKRGSTQQQPGGMSENIKQIIASMQFEDINENELKMTSVREIVELEEKAVMDDLCSLELAALRFEEGRLLARLLAHLLEVSNGQRDEQSSITALIWR